MGQLWEFEQVLRSENDTKDNDNQQSLGTTLKSLGDLKTPSTVNSTPFLWSQSSDVSKNVDGIYSTPAINGCSV